MSRESIMLRVARWEFRRFYKTKEIFWGIVIVLGVFLGQKIITQRVAAAGRETKTIAVLGGEFLPGEASGQERFAFALNEGTETDLRAAVQAEEYEALLVFTGPDAVRLCVRKESPWQEELLELLSTARQGERLAEIGVAPDVLARAAAPLAAETVEVGTGEAARVGGKWTAGVLVGLMVLAIFFGMAYLFVAITGEKAKRITEQILAVIPAQAWIDGKILGLAVLAITHVLAYVAGYVLYRVGCVLIWGEELGLPALLADPVLFLANLGIALLGFYLWFCFFGLVACTINDPNTSSRSSLLMLPLLPLAGAFAGMNSPDVLWMRIQSWFPFSAPFAMPMRLVLGEVAWWEYVLCVALLAGGIWLLRKAAGTVFGLGMLMYGKEPSWAEVWRWVRARS